MKLNSKGFSLLEIIITLAFLSIVSVPVFNLFNAINKNTYFIKTENQAYIAAANYLEENFERIKNLNPGYYTEFPGTLSGFSGKLQIKSYNSSPSLQIAQLKIYFNEQDFVILSRVYQP